MTTWYMLFRCCHNLCDTTNHYIPTIPIYILVSLSQYICKTLNTFIYTHPCTTTVYIFPVKSLSILTYLCLLHHHHLPCTTATAELITRWIHHTRGRSKRGQAIYTNKHNMSLIIILMPPIYLILSSASEHPNFHPPPFPTASIVSITTTYPHPPPPQPKTLLPKSDTIASAVLWPL